MLRARQKLGKYIIERKISEGGFAVVFQARDTIEGVRVALKIPHAPLVTEDILDDFRREVRLAAKLEHPNILPLKNAEMIGGHFVVATALGEMSLDDRLKKRIAMVTALDLSEQMLEAVAYAHSQHIIHCDIKPDNFILFPGNQLRLMDFGISRVAQKTIKASGAGTVGFVAPEQAMGKPSFASDVFSLGLVMYRMYSGTLPEWPYQWPLAGAERLRRRAHPDLIALLKRALEINTRRRFRDAGQMLAAFQRLKPRASKYLLAKNSGRRQADSSRSWQKVRRGAFNKQYAKQLETKFECSYCEGPVSEFMSSCPWCGNDCCVHQQETSFPAYCPRCHRGMKLDWQYCPWCYGSGFEAIDNRKFNDRRYVGRCDNKRCEGKQLMPFMRYCPWCRRKVRRNWKIEGVKDKCPRCHWGVLKEFWSHCPWCSASLSG